MIVIRGGIYMSKKFRNQKKIIGVIVALLVVTTAFLAPIFLKHIERKSLKEEMVASAKEYMEANNIKGSMILTNDFLIKENILGNNKFSQYSYVDVKNIEGENYYEPVVLENKVQAMNSDNEFIAALAAEDAWEQLDYICIL